MNTIETDQKRRELFLRSVARHAAAELEQLRTIPKSSPAFDYFYDVMDAIFIQNDPERILNYSHEKKQMIGIYCMVIPEELIYAAGAVPIRLCSGSFEASQIGEDFVPRDGCPLVKSAMGFSSQSGLKAFDMCDVVVIPTTCDAKRKLGEELSLFKEVWMVELPHIKNADFSRQIWVEQMYALKARLEKYVRTSWAKNRITAQRLSNAIKNSARAQSEIRRVMDIRKSTQSVIWGRQAMTVLNSYFYAPVTDWTEAMVRLNNDLSDKIQKGETVCHEKSPRILIAGSPGIFPNLKIPGIVEEMGGVVVNDESCAGERYLYDPVGNTENNLRDQMNSIASRYMAPCVCPSFTPNSDRLFMIKKMVAEYAVDGILYHVLKGCVIYDFEVHRVEDVLKESGLPLLRIETDYNPEDVEQLRTRVEAFIEMLKARKKTGTQPLPSLSR